jgi:hypothetical protein
MNRKAHRVAWELANGRIQRDGGRNRTCVLHRCDNPLCVRAEPGGGGHLFLGTLADNSRDMVAKGRAAVGDWNPASYRSDTHPDAKGEANPFAKLTDDAVREIRRLHEPRRVSYAALARRFGVSRAVVGAIVRRDAWAHVA